MDTNEREFRVAWDDGLQVVRIDWLPGSVCGLDAAQRAITAIQGLGRGVAPLLVDMRGMAKFERDAREQFTRDQANASSIALLVDSPVTRMMANFFIGMRRMPVPIKMFDDEAAAVGWLHEQD